MQLWQASNQMVSWLKPDSEDTQCSPYDWSDDADLGEVEEFSGVGTLVVITVLGCLFIWFSFMPRRHCNHNSRLQHALELQQEQHTQQQLQLPQQQLQLPQQHTRSILHIELKQDKIQINAIDANADNWQDVMPNEDDEIQRLCLNLNGIHRLSTKANISCTSASKLFQPLQLVEQQQEREKYPQRDKDSQLSSKMIEIDRYQDLPFEEHEEAECFEDLPSEDSEEEERFVDTLDN